VGNEPYDSLPYRDAATFYFQIPGRFLRKTLSGNSSHSLRFWYRELHSLINRLWFSGQTKERTFAVVLSLTLALAYLPPSGFSSPPARRAGSEAAAFGSSAAPTFDPSKPITFVWFFGYLGGHFFPADQLSLTPEDLINTASSLSTRVGGSGNLALVTAVAEPRTIPSTAYPAVTSYVASLHQYAPLVLGRLDLNRYNATSSPTVYDEMAKFVTTFNLNGVFFDHAIIYYTSVGQAAFNDMMQQLHNLYPSIYFILNDARASPLLPSSGTTWADQAYISPSVSKDSYETVNYDAIVSLNQVWNGRVLLHLDAYAKVSGQPMGVFADQSNTTEISAVQHLVNNGTVYNYRFLYPVIGGWTFVNSTYGGTLYNSLPKGNYARGTLSSFMQTMPGTSTSTTTTSTTTTTTTTATTTTITTSTSTTSTTTSTSIGGTSQLTVATQDASGATLAGYNTVLTQNGVTVGSGFTPVTFTLNNGQSYSLLVNGYGSCGFDHWLDTGSTGNPRAVSITSATSLTAVMNCSRSQLTITSQAINGTVITGYYTELHDQSSTVLATGFTPVTYTLSNGQTYLVLVAGYGSCGFDHWLDTGSTSNQRNVSITSDTQLTAVFNCG